jgi:hypothetical protein
VSLARPTLTVDLREVLRIAQIDFQAERLGPLNEIPDPARYPPARAVAAEFSSDGFQHDVRRKTLQFASDVTFEGLHKGSVFPMLRWSCRDVGGMDDCVAACEACAESCERMAAGAGAGPTRGARAEARAAH